MWQKTYQVALPGSRSRPADADLDLEGELPRLLAGGQHLLRPADRHRAGRGGAAQHEPARPDEAVDRGDGALRRRRVVHPDDPAGPHVRRLDHVQRHARRATPPWRRPRCSCGPPTRSSSSRSTLGGHRQEDHFWQQTLTAVASRFGQRSRWRPRWCAWTRGVSGRGGATSVTRRPSRRRGTCWRRRSGRWRGGSASPARPDRSERLPGGCDQRSQRRGRLRRDQGAGAPATVATWARGCVEPSAAPAGLQSLPWSAATKRLGTQMSASSPVTSPRLRLNEPTAWTGWLGWACSAWRRGNAVCGVAEPTAASGCPRPCTLEATQRRPPSCGAGLIRVLGRTVKGPNGRWANCAVRCMPRLMPGASSGRTTERQPHARPVPHVYRSVRRRSVRGNDPHQRPCLSEGDRARVLPR